MFVYVRACIFTYLNISAYFHCLLMGKDEMKDKSVRRDEWVRWGNGWLQSEFLFLSKAYFDLNIRYLFLRGILLGDDGD